MTKLGALKAKRNWIKSYIKKLREGCSIGWVIADLKFDLEGVEKEIADIVVKEQVKVATRNAIYRTAIEKIKGAKVKGGE